MQIFHLEKNGIKPTEGLKFPTIYHNSAFWFLYKSSKVCIINAFHHNIKEDILYLFHYWISNVKKWNVLNIQFNSNVYIRMYKCTKKKTEKLFHNTSAIMKVSCRSCDKKFSSSSNRNKKPKRLENSQLTRKTHVNKIFEFILEQCVANYYGDNTIAK